MFELECKATAKLPPLDQQKIWGLAKPVVWTGKTEGSTGGEGEYGLDYRVMDGFATEEHCPELWAWAELLLPTVKALYGDDMQLMASKASAVNVNILETGHSYEPHVDPNEVTAVGFWNDDFEGGELVIDNYVVVPKAGEYIIFEAGKYSHQVLTVTKGRRFTAVIGFEKANTRELTTLEKQLYGE